MKNIILKITASAFLLQFLFIAQLIATEIPTQTVNRNSTTQSGRTITGIITDKDGEVLPGVSVIEKKSNAVAITDAEGEYTINVPDGNVVLSFSYIGYTAQEIVVGNRNIIDVKMMESSIAIDEVIVIGYGTQKRNEVTAAVSSLREDAFNTTAAPSSVLELAQGKLAGVTITTPNGTDPRSDTEIQIRGVSSITGGTRPLIVIDGVPGSDLSLVQPEDIESFSVLKDASAAAIYGTRGANGVVLITTKKAKLGVQKPVFDYSSSVSHGYVYRSPKVLSAAQYREYMNSGGYNTASMTDYGGDTDWLGEMIDTGNMSQNHNLSIAGGANRSGYRASVYYRDFNPIARESDQTSWGGRLNITHWGLNDKLEVQLNLSANFRKRNMTGSNDAFEQAAQRNPTMNPKDSNGNWIDDQGFGSYNPLANYATKEDLARRTTLLGSSKITLHITDDLRVSTMASWQQYDDLRSQYLTKDSKASTDSYSGGGRAQKWQEQDVLKTIESTIDYSRTFNTIHAVNIVAGHSYQYQVNEKFDAWNSGFQTDIFKYNNLGSGTGVSQGTSFAGIGSDKQDSKLAAFFGRINYVLMDKYQLSATFRYEGSSRFGPNNRWGSFPAISAGWVISKEAFMKDVTFVNNLKLRAGFGVTGNQDIPNYRYMITLTPNSTYPVDNTVWNSAYRPSRNPNPDLKWEKKEEYNIGVVFSFLSNRLGGSIDVYNRTTKDLLYTYTTQLPPFVLSDIYTNVGTMVNKGIEFGLTAMPIVNKDFSWNVNATFTYQKNNVKSFSNQLYKGTFIDNYQFTGVGYLGYAVRTEEGVPLGSFYGHRYAGLDENGEWLFYNKNNQAVSFREITDEDKTYIGNGNPKYYASLGNTFKYKNWDLTVFLRGKFDFKILNTKELYYGNLAWLPQNVLESATTKHSNIHVSMQYSDYYLENGDFVKLDNLTLGYTFNLKNRNWVRKLRIYAAAQNLATITGYSGTTPEVRDTGLTPGIEERTFYPVATTILFGLNLGF
ncbi:MAG: TonB-dependent receptor [Dysgonamonadaceae bacterium]|jgi:TonB-linked SusC/RagA family outer membrane protein|nr:TonB-dependent receptor [Dysgonamonadaceae bacterium]